MSTATVMVVEDDPELMEALTDTLSLAGYSVARAVDGADALQQLDSNDIDLIVSDIQMPKMDGHTLLKKVRANHPDLPMMLMTAYGSIQQAVDAMRDGAVDYMVKPFEAEVLVNMVSRYAGQPASISSEIVAEDARSQELFQIAKRVARSDAAVLISGESGVGKEVIARFVHDNSERADQPFVAINCAAIPENMLEATLFGYEKGAYTGAYKACPGKFEQAQGGTLLLDEITEMAPGLQAKLLRVLQEKEVERLGGTRVIKLDVRVIATSNRKVRDFIVEGKFREDLFYRLNVFPIHIPPLRERRDDIVPLAQKLLERHCKAQKMQILEISDDAKIRLTKHTWSGNVRELDNVIQRALILRNDVIINADDIHFEIATPRPFVQENGQIIREAEIESINPESLTDELKQKEWNVIINTIQAVNGSRKMAAERLGISQRTLRYKLARMRDAGIELPAKSSAEIL